jgi:hypothetical protein
VRLRGGNQAFVLKGAGDFTAAGQLIARQFNFAGRQSRLPGRADGPEGAQRRRAVRYDGDQLAAQILAVMESRTRTPCYLWWPTGFEQI